MKQKIKLFSVRLRYVYMCDQKSPILKLCAILNLHFDKEQTKPIHKTLVNLKMSKNFTVGGNQPIQHLYFPYGHPFLPCLMVLR